MGMPSKTRTLVIGGTTGIGKDIADTLREYHHVDAPPIDMLDVTDPTSISEFIWGNDRYDEIVYSAGLNWLMPIGEIRNPELESMFDVNVMGFIRVLSEVCRPIPGEFTRLPRAVVAIVSDSATVPMRCSIGYAASKAALAHAIRCAARELAPGCRVNGVSPSMVASTPMTASVDRQVRQQRGWTAQEAYEYEMSLVPMNRRCAKSEVTQVVMDLLDGPDFLTGAIVPLTGGKS